MKRTQNKIIIEKNEPNLVLNKQDLIEGIPAAQYIIDKCPDIFNHVFLNSRNIESFVSLGLICKKVHSIFIKLSDNLTTSSNLKELFISFKIFDSLITKFEQKPNPVNLTLDQILSALAQLSKTSNQLTQILNPSLEIANKPVEIASLKTLDLLQKISHELKLILKYAHLKLELEFPTKLSELQLLNEELKCTQLSFETKYMISKIKALDLSSIAVNYFNINIINSLLQSEIMQSQLIVLKIGCINTQNKLELQRLINLETFEIESINLLGLELIFEEIKNLKTFKIKDTKAILKLQKFDNLETLEIEHILGEATIDLSKLKIAKFNAIRASLTLKAPNLKKIHLGEIYSNLILGEFPELEELSYNHCYNNNAKQSLVKLEQEIIERKKSKNNS